MTTGYDVVKTLLRTEKGTTLEPDRKYLFEVATGASKIEIKKAIEEIYSVKVQEVNTMVVSGKKKRVRHQLGRTPDWKKAIVTLKEGNKIVVT